MSLTTRRQSTYGKKPESYNKNTPNPSDNSKEHSASTSNDNGKNKNDENTNKVTKRQKVKSSKPNIVLTTIEVPNITQTTTTNEQTVLTIPSKPFVFEESEVYEMEIDNSKKSSLSSLQDSSTNDSIHANTSTIDKSQSSSTPIFVKVKNKQLSWADQVENNVNEPD
jgi:hypothetical protein